MVFNAASWETHFASAHLADILEAFADRCLTLDELEDLLLHPDAGEDERNQLLKYLANLEDLGLIRKA